MGPLRLQHLPAGPKELRCTGGAGSRTRATKPTEQESPWRTWRAGSARRTSRDRRGSPPGATACAPEGRAPVLPPAAGPHVVDDHGLVGDNVVGLHGRARPALPSAGLQEEPAGVQTCTAVALDTAARPSHPASAAYASPAGLAGGRSPHPGQSPFPLARIDGGRPGPLRAKGRGLRVLTSQLRPPGSTAGALSR